MTCDRVSLKNILEFTFLPRDLLVDLTSSKRESMYPIRNLTSTELLRLIKHGSPKINYWVVQKTTELAVDGLLGTIKHSFTLVIVKYTN